MLLIKLKYYIHVKIAEYYYHKQEKYFSGTKKWEKCDDKFWTHISIANELRDKYRF